MPEPGSSTILKYRVAQTLAAISGVFCLTVMFFLTAVFIRMRTVEPLDSPLLTELRLPAVENGSDDRLRSDYREIDLLARRAHFTGLEVYRTGAILLLCGGIAFILALKYVAGLKAARPQPERYGSLAEMGDPLAFSRRAVAWAGLALLALVAAAVFVMPSRPGGGNATGEAGAEKKPEEYPSVSELRANWPGFRGPDGLGVAYAVDPPLAWNGEQGSNIRWKTIVPLPGFSSAVVWKRDVIITGGDKSAREVYCFDAVSGELRWRHAVTDVPGSPAEAPEVAGDTGFAAATAAVDGRRAYAIFATGDLIALDMQGNRVWARNLGVPDNPYGHSSSLLVNAGTLFVQLDDNTGGRVLGLNASTGETVWESTRETLPSWASPVLVRSGGQAWLVINGNPEVVAYDAADGREIWRMECLGGEVAPSPAWDDGLVFAGNEYASLAAIAPGKPPEIVWKELHELPEVSSPVAWRGLLFVATSYGAVTCRDAKTGEIRWQREFDKGFYSSPIISAERVYLMDREGVTHIFRAAVEYEALGTSPLGEKADATPAFVGRRIYLRGKKYIYCLEEE